MILMQCGQKRVIYPPAHPSCGVMIGQYRGAETRANRKNMGEADAVREEKWIHVFLIFLGLGCVGTLQT